MRHFLRLIFMPCNGISRLVSQSLDRDLTRGEALAVRIHLLYCRACRQFRRHIAEIRKMLSAASEARGAFSDLTLSPEARARLEEMLGP